jgi:hypothetical protein
MRSLQAILVLGVLGMLAGFLVAGCVKSRCFQNADCGAGEVCDRALGTCFPPECLATVPCPAGSFCEEFRCVAGCGGDEECQPGEKCIDARCLPYREQCNCLAATDFCLADRNPGSPSYLEKLCVSDYDEHGVALFFGSVGCPHCWHLYGQLREMKQELAGDGVVPDLLFINIKSVDATPEKISQGMSDVSTPIVQDGEAVGFWDAYLADWYHFVLVDRSGCIAAHYGPLSSEGLDGAEGQEIRAAWKASLAAECTPSEPDAGPDAAGDIQAGDLEDSGTEEQADQTAAEDKGPGDFDAQPQPDLVDTQEGAGQDAAGDSDAELPGEDVGDLGDSDVEPFQLAEVCQVVETPPVPLGGDVPYFLCMDRNSKSPGYLSGFSTTTLAEKVWIAYFGACT